MASTRDTVVEAIREIAGQYAVTDATTLEDLGLDSLDHVELTLDLEDRLSIEISDDDAEAWKTVADVVAYADRVKKS